MLMENKPLISKTRTDTHQAKVFSRLFYDGNVVCFLPTCAANELQTACVLVFTICVFCTCTCFSILVGNKCPPQG